MKLNVVPLVAALALCISPFAHGQSSAPALHILITSGGPDPANNQVAIESNVRYVTRLLPPTAKRRTLFANGRPETRDVEYEEKDGEHFRASILKTVDGPSRLDAFHRELTGLATSPTTPLLLYFTGHGSGGELMKRHNNYDANSYDLWAGQELSVQKLAGEISALPKDEPVTIVMVQCFSGGFGSLLFDGGLPKGSLTDRPICGFFASIAPRTAAGCTPEINEADYHDFTGYFFAALSGIDRVGHPVANADYNHDGVVGMDEAYAYALIHDDSIDTPVCTSDVFLRRYVKCVEKQLLQHPYSMVYNWASPAQAAALDGLSTFLGLRGEDRLIRASHRLDKTYVDTEEQDEIDNIRFVRLAKSVVLAHLLKTDASSLPSGAVDHLRTRYAELIKMEAANPLR